MGRSFTPKFAVDLDAGVNNARIDCLTWDSKRHGTPTAANLERYVMAHAKSLEPGGINAHLCAGLGFIPYPRWARIRRNVARGPVVAEWKAATFQVYG